MPEDIIVRSPNTEQEWCDYYLLRWQILRKPWSQPLGSERDEHENSSYHLLAIDKNKTVIGVGRIHKINDFTAQIRYMAVSDLHRHTGIGSNLLVALENKATNWSCNEIVLNARNSCQRFYQKHAYLIVEAGPTLYGSITHTKMKKNINS